MRFDVLGPLAVWTDAGAPVAVPGLKVRALLADLVAHRGDLIPAARLIDDLWGEALPGNPQSALQVKVSQLRKALADAESGARSLVVSRSPGYLLDVPPGCTDVGRFHALTTRAAAADPAARATLLAEALALWRGPALADFADEPFTRPVTARLEEDRLTALELWVEARLELGEHTGLVAELEDLVARYPLRERLRAAHVRALYGAGRQSAALASYGELRERLADELGLDPSAGLTALHQAVLTRDPALDATPRAPRGNLPAQLSDLVGRDDDLAGVRSALGSARLVTLTGPGGVGKTRLAVETATRLTGAFPDGVWLVELAPLTAATPEPLVEAVTAALGLRDDVEVGQPLDPVARLADALRARELLLVLDNCEHVVEPAAELVNRLLRAAPRLRVLATSQEPLGLAGEVRRDVAPLDREGAVELFVTRAAAASPGFRLDDDNAGDVAVLCRRLDGIPLALELAANRVRALGVSGLVERLDDRFRLLATGYRGAAPRQRTLRAMIDWSWDLLPDPERAVLRRLARHGESATLEAAEAVCAGGEVTPADVLDLLTRLVDRSLVVPVEARGPRYRLLESVAAYCLDQPGEPGEADSVRTRHREYYLALAERAEPHLRAGDQQRWLERLDRESANLRAAFDGAVRDGDRDAALRLVTALAWYWCLRGRFAEARRSLDAAVGSGGDGPLVAVALAWRTGIAILQGDSTDRTARIARVVELVERFPEGRARAFWFLDYALSRTGDVAAEGDLVNRALAEFEAAGDLWGTAAALGTRACQALARGDLATLDRDGRRSAALFAEVGDRWGQSRASAALAALAEIRGDYAHAARLHRDGLRAAEQLGLWPEVVDRLNGLGRVALLTGDFAIARESHGRALRMAAEQNAKTAEVSAELGLALGARREGDLDAAETRLCRLLEWSRGSDFAEGVGHALAVAELGFVAELRGDPAEAAVHHLTGLGIARKSGDPRAVALALEGLAGALTLDGRAEAGALLLGAATAARASVGAPLPPAERGDYDRVCARVEESLDAAALAAALSRGATLTTREIDEILTPPG
ncbi:AfsR/SARP family transcriptional regulator [Saccharothrix luteola]|uniref:AfsR/SARP family transcriptional regulator n=1 Tax=Saccharothrix luteola TaxID=2893018 RepID=UPI001E52B6DD|nr:BTAD domain-containing putative transcriptional regulator [Saccharothrix luteola]MCC8243875.1 winged helix-turn-helix domain-containing protein [Saccharothrix luteola]